MINNKLVSTRLLLSVGFIMSAQLSEATKLSIDGTSPVNLSINSNYNTSNQTIEFNSSDPVVCRNVSNQSSGLKAAIVDPNGDGVDMNLLQDVSYRILTQTFNAKINNVDGVCVTNKGNNYGDLIFRNQFVPAAFRTEGLNDQLVRGQSVDYTIRVENPEDSVMRFDLIEYVSSNSAANAAFFESVDVWNCLSHNISGVVCNLDNTNNKLFNATIPSGGVAEIDVSRTVGSNSAVGQSVDILTALFMKNSQNEIVDVQVINKNSLVVDNNAPVISWVNNTALNFVEDDSQGQSLSFNVIDNTGVNLTVNYLSTAIGGVNDKVEIENIAVNENQPGNYLVTFDVLPKADQFTSTGNTEQIFVQIEDDFNASSNLLMLPINITPINDAPSFQPSCLDFTINPTPVGGQTEISCNVSSNGVNRANWNYTDFISEISAGGINNDTESNQSVIFEVLPVSGLATQNSVIVITEPGTFILNDLMLILADGITGSGSFKLRALDNGTPQGISNVCPAQTGSDHCNTSEYSEEIVFNVVAPVYYIQGTIDDMPSSDEIFLRLYETGTNNPLGSSFSQAGQGATGNQSIKFTFPTALTNGVDYEVRIILQPDNRACSIASGATGIINNMNMNDLTIDCEPN